MRFRALVLIADGTPDSAGERIHIEDVHLPTESVWVTYNYSNELRDAVGWAALEAEGDRVYADIVLNEYAIRDLKALAHYYPGIGGYNMEKEIDGKTVPSKEAPLGPCRLKKVTITCIGLHTTPNADSRIKPLGEQGLSEVRSRQPPRGRYGAI